MPVSATAPSDISFPSTPTIVREETSLREQNIKHFQLSDGSYTAVVYGEPVHYNQDGQWVDIDNSLVSATLVDDLTTGKPQDATASRTNQNAGTYLTNSANDFTVQLPKKLTADTPVGVRYGGHSLQFQFDAVDTAAQISQPRSADAAADELQSQLTKIKSSQERARLQNEQAATVYKSRSSVTYAAVKTGVDLQYYVQGQRLKEALVFHSLPTEEAFSFSLFCTGLRAELADDNRVLFYDEKGDGVFTIAAPYMFDSDEGYSQDVKVVLETTDSGYRYTLIPDRTWLEDEKRVYPVTLDPSCEPTTQNTNYIHDNGVQQSDPTTTYMTTDRIYVGSAANSKEGRMYFKLTQWPSKTGLNANTITKAELNLTYYPQASYQTGNNFHIDVYPLVTYWDTKDINWNNQPYRTGAKVHNGLNIGDHRNKVSGADVYNVTDWVRAHYASPATDYGIRLQPSTVSSSLNRVCYISSDYYTHTEQRPVIKIYYYVFAGVKGVRNAPSTSYYSYNCQSYAFWLTPPNGVEVFTQLTSKDVKDCRSGTVANALAITKTRMVSFLNTNFSGKWREVSSYDADLSSNEWLVCMRVGVLSRQYDYHFWYRANDGSWYNKHGYLAASEKVSGDVIDPSTANTSDGWQINGVYFYSSATAYYAIQQ